VVIVSARLKDVVSGAALVYQWNVTSQQNVAVQVVLPAEAEVAERRARHAKLDAITARLLEVDRQTPGGGVTPSVALEEGSESAGADDV
jgi:hypothetical protein